ncbi:CopG family transcriptional regulator [Marinomonas sp. 42_23_T18]|nr:CopG family transcriptional regulator [Marinomonas sp. 42_23_T18]
MKFKSKTFILAAAVVSSQAFAATIDLYKSKSCGCCKAWAEIMEKNGHDVKVHADKDWSKVRQDYGLPYQLGSCHTAIIDGYLIEGHVPQAEIDKLLKEKPSNIAGLSAPGMPMHSPGMAKEGAPFKDFQVVSFDKKGNMNLYRQY